MLEPTNPRSTPKVFSVPLSGPIGPWWAQRPVSESQRECDHPEWRDLKEAGYQCTTCKLIVDDPGEPT